MTVKRITFLQELLSFMGLGDRLHLEWISSAEAQKFVRVITDFTEKIRSLGPNPLMDKNAAGTLWIPDAPPLKMAHLPQNIQLARTDSTGRAEEASHESESKTVA